MVCVRVTNKRLGNAQNAKGAPNGEPVTRFVNLPPLVPLKVADTSIY